MGLVETTTNARMYIFVGPMGGARNGNVAVRSSRWHESADWWSALVRAAARQPSWLELVAAGWGVIRQGRTRVHFGRPPHYIGLNHAHLPLLSFTSLVFRFLPPFVSCLCPLSLVYQIIKRRAIESSSLRFYP